MKKQQWRKEKRREEAFGPKNQHPNQEVGDMEMEELKSGEILGGRSVWFVSFKAKVRTREKNLGFLS